VSQHALGGVVEVNEGTESVLLPCIDSGTPPEDPLLIWTRSDLSPNSVHLRRENGDDLKNQNQRFRGRTSMNPDALDTGNFSLTLRKPEQDDGGNYSCSISDGIEERNLKQIHLKVKGQLNKQNEQRLPEDRRRQPDPEEPQRRRRWTLRLHRPQRPGRPERHCGSEICTERSEHQVRPADKGQRSE
uniref:Ig-like domain-containing protein n=1 Tax=Poecilia latipinna TaxID=48699 RepID=A0A3B3W2Z2_9TELE